MGKEYQGVNRSTFLLDKNGKIIKIYEKVKPAGHSKEILEYFIKGGETNQEGLNFYVHIWNIGFYLFFLQSYQNN